jgi:NADH dehydrogenase/NADH:ubiquinone oxidoreductase subunit G
MGALTLKSFPFELRGWDIEKFESLDPTDSFGSNTRVYVSKDQIVLIEPDYNVYTFNTWLTDKGRQFFDGMFGSWNQDLKKSKTLTTNFWPNMLKSIIETIYILDHCNKQQLNKKYITIVFENVSLETLNLLLLLSQNYSFIKLRRAESNNLINDSEKTFQLNIAANKIKLNNSTLGFLIANNPRYEGYYLNLNLRQRFLKGNFKCLTIGSLINLTFPVTCLGSNTQVLKSISEGNSLVCQDFKGSKNPVIIFNNELFKRNDGNNLIQMLENLNYYSNSNKNKWNGLNMISSSLSENGNHLLTKFPFLNLKDLNDFSLLYFINVTTNNVSNLKKVTELNLLNYSYIKQKSSQKNSLVLDQNYMYNKNYTLVDQILTNTNKELKSYNYIPTSTFYENEETFVNTEGFIKRTTKLISRKQTRNNWQIIRKLFKSLKNNFISLELKNNQLIVFNSNKIVTFKNYINFHYYAVQSLTNLNFYLSVKTTPVNFIKNNSLFKNSSRKIKNTKLKYWLDDFFTGGKDEYSQNSLILTNCSRILRSESTNFF